MSASGAYFQFIKKKNGSFIRKSFRGDPSKIKYQYEWLSARRELKCIPQVEAPVFLWDYSSYDLRFYNDYRSFFELIKERHENQAPEVLKLILENLDLIHTSKVKVSKSECARNYIEEKCFRKIAYCENLFPLLFELNKRDKLFINGKELANIALIKKKLQDQKLLAFIGEYEESSIHGDITAENILVGPHGEIVFLDPNNENLISSPLVDYAKLYQSLHSRYEELCMLEKVEHQFERISFERDTSLALFAHLEKELEGRVSEDDKTRILFHEALHFARLLPYRLRANDKSFLAFYGTMLERFDDFFKRWEA